MPETGIGQLALERAHARQANTVRCLLLTLAGRVVGHFFSRNSAVGFGYMVFSYREGGGSEVHDRRSNPSCMQYVNARADVSMHARTVNSGGYASMKNVPYGSI